MRILVKVTVLAVALVYAGVGTVDAQVLDQNQPAAPDFMAGFFNQTDLAQSFQQSADNIVGAGIFLQEGIGTTDNVTISVWTGLPNSFGATMLATGSAMGTAGSWVDVFWDAVGVTPGDTYFLVFTGNTTLGISGSVQDPYPHGQVYANTGYASFPGFDYTFRTWAEQAPTTTVPEPMSVVLLGTGLAGVVAVNRRRRRNAGLHM